MGFCDPSSDGIAASKEFKPMSLEDAKGGPSRDKIEHQKRKEDKERHEKQQKSDMYSGLAGFVIIWPLHYCARFYKHHYRTAVSRGLHHTARYLVLTGVLSALLCRYWGPLQAAGRHADEPAQG